MTDAAAAATPGPSEDDLLAFLAGFADPDTEHRVLAAALTDPALRSRLAAHQSLLASGDAALAAPLSGAEEAWFSDRAAALRARLRGEHGAEAEAGAAVAPSVSLGGRLREAGRRVLDLVGGPVTLPGLAPALAASATDSLQLHRQTFNSPEGARVELQQLPGDPPRLRAIVDVGSRVPDAGDTVATLHFADGAGARRASLPVRLNTEGRGLRDVLLSGEAAALPPAREAWRLVAVELGRDAAGC